MGTSRLEISVNSNMLRQTSSTSKGNQVKWFDGTYWIKRNTMGYEDIAEWVASNVMSFSTLPKSSFIDYSLCTIKHEDGTTDIGCISRNFIPSGVTLVTLYKLFERFNIDYPFTTNNNKSTDYKIKYTVESVYNYTGLDITNYLRILLTLDAFILNEDRHSNNIAFFYSNGKFDFAPIFDNGLSLLSDTKDYPFRVPYDINIRKVKSRTFSSSFSKQLEVLGVGFQIDGSKLEYFIESNKDILGRAYDVLKHQIGKYRGSIVV